MKTRLIIFVLSLLLPSCAGFPVLLTGSYSGTNDAGHTFNLGIQVPIWTGKQPVRAAK